MYSINPREKAPVILKEKMLDNMKPGSIIYDLAASKEATSATTDEVVIRNGCTNGRSKYFKQISSFPQIFTKKYI